MEEKMFFWSKRVKEQELKFNEIKSRDSQQKVFSILESLLKCSQKSKYIEETKLTENCKDWIKQIFLHNPATQTEIVRYLLNDFTEKLMTRMREIDKYVIAILYEKHLFLCHSKLGEKTITPKLRIIERMLDKDNVSRFVYFKREGESTKLKFWEYYASKSLVAWLGLPPQEVSSYLSGKIRILTEILSFPLVLELNDEGAEKLLKEVKIEDEAIHMPTEIKVLPIKEIRMGSKIYKNVAEFREDFIAKRMDLRYYQRFYEDLYSNGILDAPSSGLYQYFDESAQLVRISGGKSEVVLTESNPDFCILFADGNIKMRGKFLSKLHAKAIHKEKMKIFHAGSKLSAEPIRVNNIEIYNNLVIPDYLDELMKFVHETQISDTFIKNALYYAIFFLISLENKDKSINFVLRELSKKFLESEDIPITVSNIENRIIEYKSSDILKDGDKEIARKLIEDLMKKIKESPIKLYIIGIDESTREIEPISSGKFSDDRANNVRSAILSKAEKQMDKKIGLVLTKVPLENGKKFILLMLAHTID